MNVRPHAGLTGREAIAPWRFCAAVRAVGIVGAAAAVAVIAVLAAPARAQSYLHEDARLSGREIHTFAEGGQTVSVVVGDFRLTLGKHIISGRDAVVWIASRQVGQVAHHEITAYVEGDARVVEPGGPTTMDRLMLVTVRTRGRVSAAGRMSDRPLKDFPLYRRAVEARAAPAGGPPTPQEPPALVVATSRPMVGPASRPAGAPAGAGEPPGAERPGEAIKVAKPSAPRRVDPVTFHADRFTSQEVGEGPQKRRITIARGNVYLCQGNPDSDLFLELRAQAAVVFSERSERKKLPDSKLPWAPKVTGVQTEGAGGQEEAVTGVYLEGDVIIARGDRSLRGPSAYYDFTANRALVVDPVFRAVQEERNIPIFVRASEARVLSDREVQFKDARISSSDFYTPSYHIGASTAYLKNTTPYDEKGQKLAETTWLASLTDTTFNVGGVPLLYLPKTEGDFREGHTPLRRAQIGSHGALGFGGETEWNLFRLLGLLEPKGVEATLELNWYDRGPFAGVNLEYDRETYSGYAKVYGLVDREGNDDFGEERKNILAPDERGRILARHKQTLPSDWTLQLELSYLCDRNFLEQFFPDEAYAGKEQETLLYAKKQRDNWAMTTLLQYRLNRFDEQTESAPDLGFYLLGEPLWQDRLTLFSEARVGLKRHRLPNFVTDAHGDFLGRLDTRQEIDVPMDFGPLSVTPYAVGRATFWSDQPEGGEDCRLYGQIGVRASTHIWRIYRDVESRLWDLHGLKHVITPQAVAFLGEAADGVTPTRRVPWNEFVDLASDMWDLRSLRYGLPPEASWLLGHNVDARNQGDLFPMDPDIEQHLGRLSGAAFTLSQRLQTKRGPADNRRTVDWMRLDATLGAYDNDFNPQTSDGRFSFYRPEYSIGRNHLNVDYAWNISDSTVFLADFNHDLNSGQIRRWDVGLAVSREPRFRYYVGVRSIRDLDSTVGTFAITYKIDPKYTISFLQQVDMDYDGHESLASSITIVRKFPRWYVGVTLVMDRRTDDLGLYLTIWPEGIPEVRVGSSRMAVLSESDLN